MLIASSNMLIACPSLSFYRCICSRLTFCSPLAFSLFCRPADLWDAAPAIPKLVPFLVTVRIIFVGHFWSQNGHQNCSKNCPTNDNKKKHFWIFSLRFGALQMPLGCLLGPPKAVSDASKAAKWHTYWCCGSSIYWWPFWSHFGTSRADRVPTRAPKVAQVVLKMDPTINNANVGPFLGSRMGSKMGQDDEGAP